MKKILVLIIAVLTIHTATKAQQTSEVSYEAGEKLYNAGTKNPFNNCREYEWFKIVPEENRFKAALKRSKNVFCVVDATLVYTVGTLGHTIPLVKTTYRLGVDPTWK